MKAAIVVIGALMVIAGLFGLAYPIFSTTYRENIAEVPGWKVKLEQEHNQFIPQTASGGLIVVGSVLVTAGLVVRTRAD